MNLKSRIEVSNFYYKQTKQHQISQRRILWWRFCIKKGFYSIFPFCSLLKITYLILSFLHVLK